MLQSHVIDIDGRFVGIAVRIDRGFRFVAVDPRTEDLGEIIWPDIDDIRRMARLVLAMEQAPHIDRVGTAGRMPTPPAE